MNRTSKITWIIINLLLISSLISCSNAKGIRCINTDDFVRIIQKEFDLKEDKEPFSYNLSGRDYGIYRVSNYSDERTQIVGYYKETNIVHSYFSSPAIAHVTYLLPHDIYREDISGDYSTDKYEYFFLDGYYDEEYMYGGIYHIDNMILRIYTNENTTEAREETDEVISLLGFPEMK